MLYRLIAVVAATLAFAPNLWAAGDTTLIHAGELLAVPGQSPARNKTIVVENDRIVAVRDGFVSADSVDGEATEPQVDLLDDAPVPLDGQEVHDLGVLDAQHGRLVVHCLGLL